MPRPIPSPAASPPPCRRFPRDNAGATAVEFALVATPLIALCVAALQTAILFFAEQELQTATRDASRLLKRITGDSLSQSLSSDDFAGAVCQRAAPTFDCAGLMIDVESVPSFGGGPIAPLTLTYDPQFRVTNRWAYSPGGPGDVVIVRVMYRWPIFGSLLGIGLANQPDGSRLLIGVALYKNEPAA